MCREPGREAWQPAYASIVWVMQHALRLAAPRVLYNAEQKKLFLQTFVLLLTGGNARLTDPAVLMEVLLIVKRWLLDPKPAGQGKSPFRSFCCPRLCSNPKLAVGTSLLRDAMPAGCRHAPRRFVCGGMSPIMLQVFQGCSHRRLHSMLRRISPCQVVQP